MSFHPVQLHVHRVERLPRIQVLIRLVLVLALGIIGWSSIYWLLYLAMPALVAVRLSQQGPKSYFSQHAPGLVRALRWLVGAEAYLCFLTNVLPTSEGSPVDLQINLTGVPTARTALLRLVFNLPALLLVAVLTMASGFVWLLAALAALISERVPRALAEFLLLAIRVRFRFIAYHLSLVDRYPSLVDQSVDQHSLA